jgi:release factor glutamine methyltransferase
MTTAAQALRQAERALAAAGVPDPGWDAELLLRHALGWSRAELLANAAAPLPADAERSLVELVAERASRRPLQHLIGVQAFWRHEFVVTPDTLIPRPETEILVEATLVLLRGRQRPVVVDVGTGSGCVALSLALEMPDSQVYATDISAAALAVAAENARRLGCADRVELHCGDLLDPVTALSGRIDVIASNPPYVDPSEAASLPPEVREHEPALALFPPDDAYSIYRTLAPQAFAALAPGGALVVEIGLGMAPEVRRILSRAGFIVERVVADLQSIPRTVVALRPPPRRAS